LCAASASENEPATRMTISPKSVSSPIAPVLSQPMGTFSALAGLPLLVERCTLEPRELAVSPQFLRRTTVVHLHGGAQEGVGEHEFRRWAFEWAALDRALRQAGRSLHEVLGLEPRPVRFVVSTRPERMRRFRAVHAGLRFKLDPVSDWDE